MNEVFNVVESINFKIDEKFLENNPDLCLSYETNGHVEAVSFAGVHIWCSENSDRRYDYDNDTYLESWEEYFLRKIEETATDFLQFIHQAKTEKSRN